MSALHEAVRRGSSAELGQLLALRRSEGGSVDGLDDVSVAFCCPAAPDRCTDRTHASLPGGQGRRSGHGAAAPGGGVLRRCQGQGRHLTLARSVSLLSAERVDCAALQLHAGRPGGGLAARRLRRRRQRRLPSECHLRPSVVAHRRRTVVPRSTAPQRRGTRRQWRCCSHTERGLTTPTM